jgi:hypothetical protein
MGWGIWTPIFHNTWCIWTGITNICRAFDLTKTSKSKFPGVYPGGCQGFDLIRALSKNQMLNKGEFRPRCLNSCLYQVRSPVLTLIKNFLLNFVHNTVLKAFENNADVSTFIFLRRCNSGGINYIDSKFLVNTRNNDINNIKKLPVESYCLLLTVKMGKIHHFCNKICCKTSMFINSRMATIVKYRDVQVYSGKMSWYSVIFRDIPWYSGIFRDIPPYSVIFRHIPWYSVIFRRSGFSQRPM